MPDAPEAQPVVVIPVLAEVLQPSVERNVTGVVRLTKSVTQQEQVIDLGGLETSFEVERVMINREVDLPPEPRQEGETTIYPVVEEVVVVTRRYRLKEEVRVTRRDHRRTDSQSIPLRKEEFEISHHALPGTDITAQSFAPFQEGILEFSETQESVVVTKTARVIEEVVVTKDVIEHQTLIHDTLRHTEVEVELFPAQAAKV